MMRHFGRPCFTQASFPTPSRRQLLDRLGLVLQGSVFELFRIYSRIKVEATTGIELFEHAKSRTLHMNSPSE
jgi:hypothetical protein